MQTCLHGIWVPLATPMEHGELDLAALQRLADRVIDDGAHGLVVCGTTGEAPQLDLAEQSAALAAVLCGDDEVLFAALCGGAHGAISASAHIRTDLYVQLFDLVRAQRLAEARALAAALLPVMRLLFSEPNPAPLKAALTLQGRLRDELRLPMVSASMACKEKLAAALEALDGMPTYRAAVGGARPDKAVSAATGAGPESARYSLAHATAAV